MSTTTSRSISAAVERQMRNWELARQQQPPPDQTERVTTQPFVTFSRMVGSGGADTARMLADTIGWPLFDREVLQHMAGDDHVRRRIYEVLDERDISFIEETMRSFTAPEYRRDDYFHRLSETVLALARRGHAIFLGRGADLVLPRDVGLRVRIMALPAVCAERFAKRAGMTTVQASREIERIEQQRMRFIRSHFQIDPDAADRFDLTINLASITQEEAVNAIAGILRKRGLL